MSGFHGTIHKRRGPPARLPVDNSDGTSSIVNGEAKKLFQTHRNQMIGMDWNDIFKFCIQELPEINAGQVIFSLRVAGKLFRVIITDDGNKKLVWRRDLIDSLQPPPPPVSALIPSCECGEWVDCNRCAGIGTYEYPPSEADAQFPSGLEPTQNTGQTRDTWQTRDPTQIWLNLKAAEIALENNNRRIKDKDTEFMNSFSDKEHLKLVTNLRLAQCDWAFIRPNIKEEIEKVAKDMKDFDIEMDAFATTELREKWRKTQLNFGVV